MKYSGPRFDDNGNPRAVNINPVGGTYRPGVHTDANGKQTPVLVREQAGRKWVPIMHDDGGYLRHKDVLRSELAYT